MVSDAGLIVNANAFTAVRGVGAALSRTWIEKLEVPAAVGSPLITPVAASSVNPLGRLPEITCQLLYGGVPPVAFSD